ncbi:Zinc D-Ala-D-Ala carboxypeptidase precursor [compost metagenome]
MQLSPNFSLSEFRCRCGCGGESKPEILANLKKVAAMLEKVRQACGGKALVINSGYRCPKHNANVGGAKASLHLTGQAADVTCATLAPAEVQRIARGVPEVNGLGLGKTFTHLDVRGVRQVFNY